MSGPASTQAPVPTTWRQAAQQGCMAGIISINPEKLSGAPEIPNTRVPVRFLLDSLQSGEPLSEFLEDYPAVTREQAEAVLEYAFNCAIGPRDAQNPVR